jgi:hypothetical protein
VREREREEGINNQQHQCQNKTLALAEVWQEKRGRGEEILAVRRKGRIRIGRLVSRSIYLRRSGLDCKCKEEKADGCDGETTPSCGLPNAGNANTIRPCGGSPSSYKTKFGPWA